jgi:excinuclease ABC subunit A
MKRFSGVRQENIEISGARVHNLKNIDIVIPRNKLTVITGLSGSGKSSLAFDTIYAEGQRRYIETFSAYARNFIGNLERPDVDKISGLSPVIAIEQKTVSRNPRSTVGTTTEIYDFLRLLFSRASEAFSYVTGEKMVKYSEVQINNLINQQYQGKNISILAPLVKGRKGHYQELFDRFRRKGFLYARINEEIKELRFGLKVDRYKVHNIELVVDRIIINEDSSKRLRESVQIAMKQGGGICMVIDDENHQIRYFSRSFMCPTSGISYNEPAPHSFSFNSPQGACPHCSGQGRTAHIDLKKIIPDPTISIARGGIAPLGKYRSSLIFWQLEAIAAKYGFSLKTPIQDIPEDSINVILYGSGETFKLQGNYPGISSNYLINWEGLANYILNQHNDATSLKAKQWSNDFVISEVCQECNGSRLKKEALYFKIDNKNISELSQMNLSDLYKWFENLEGKLNPKQIIIAHDLLKEIRNRLKFIIDVGIDYLSLNRPAASLSGGESQRIRLATQIGSRLVNVLYILDEPSIGLHQRDNYKLINSLKQLRDSGNTVIVVEHDKQMIMSADYVIDIGPQAGINGGSIIAKGSPDEILKQNGLTADYLSLRKSIAIPTKRRNGNGLFLILKGATGNNLKNVAVKIPLGKLVCITGVSGSGKSSLIKETLQPILSKHFFRALRNPLPYKSIEGIENIDKVIEVDQSPIGRTPRSNPVTYTQIFSDIRKLFEQLPASKVRGYNAGRFSFNVKGGRCEGCGGAGVKTIEMNFLPDVYVTCTDCNGRRYNRETLEVRYRGKSISDVLDMTVGQAVDFFENIPVIHNKLKALNDVGLGYITLGQQSTTLSGGEAQRIKLAAEFTKKDTGKTLYILDEPTTGLHFEDVKILMNVLCKLVDKGNTVIIIEHNLDVIKLADHIIDLGPEGGIRGGKIIAEGTPEEISNNSISYTSPYLKEELTFNKVSTY